MNILLTNDDGYFSEGINLLKRKLIKYGRVVIVAPKVSMSAKSFGITYGVPNHIEKIEEDVYSFDGLPSDCVAFAISMLDIDFDLVVSGCNHGFNISNDVMQSGTLGACLFAINYHKKTVAFSCDFNFEIVDKYFDEVFNFILNNNLLSDKYTLNVNFPVGDTVKDIKLGRLFFREQYTYYEKENGEYFAKRTLQDYHGISHDYDCYQVYHQIVSIVPLAPTIFDVSIYRKLKNKK